MQYTTNYNLGIAEGTDTVNLLTQCYPNFTSLDSIIKEISDNAVTVASETKVGTVHNLVRGNSDRNVIRFTATSNYVVGDTFTVDGVAVTAVTPAGTSIPGGAFLINSNVEAILNNLVLTLLVSEGVQDASDLSYDNSGSGLTATNVQDAIDEVYSDIPTIPATYDATDIDYDNTGSGLTATNAQDAIDEIVSMLPGSDYVEVVADGVKTYKNILDGLYSLIDFSKIKNTSALIINSSGVNEIYKIYQLTSNSVSFTATSVNMAGTTLYTTSATVSANSSLRTATGITCSNNSNTVVSNGIIFRIYY